MYSGSVRRNYYPTQVQHFTLLDHSDQAPVQNTFVVCTPYTGFQVLDASSLTVTNIGRLALGLAAYAMCPNHRLPLTLTPPECPPAHYGVHCCLSWPIDQSLQSTPSIVRTSLLAIRIAQRSGRTD